MKGKVTNGTNRLDDKSGVDKTWTEIRSTFPERQYRPLYNDWASPDYRSGSRGRRQPESTSPLSRLNLRSVSCLKGTEVKR